MSDAQVLRRLDDGVVIWNAWRRASKRTFVDLSTADLSGRDLRGIDFSRTDLEGANLRGARLQGADLSDAEARGALLDHAHLEGATLCAGDLSCASLVAARLAGADLSAARLVGANLKDADMEGARIKDTRFEFDPKASPTVAIDGDSRLELEVRFSGDHTGTGVLPALFSLIRRAEWKAARNGASGDPSTGMVLAPVSSERRDRSRTKLDQLEDTLLTRLSGRPFARLSDPEALRRLIEAWKQVPEATVRLGRILMLRTAESGNGRSRVERLSSAEMARVLPRGHIDQAADIIAQRLDRVRPSRTAASGQ